MRSAGAEARRGDPRDPAIARIDAATRQVHLDGGDVLRARTIILACGVAWRHLAIEGFDRLAGKGVSYGAARSEASDTHGLDVHVVGAGNSAGQAALFFSNHARTVTILCRGEGLEKSMSRYLVDQLATRSNIRVLARTEVEPPTASSLEAIDVRDAATRRDDPARVRRRCSSSSERTPRRRGCRPRSRSTAAARAHGRRRAGRRALGARPRPVPARDERARVGPQGSMAVAFVHQCVRDARGAAREPRVGTRAGARSARATRLQCPSWP